MNYGARRISTPFLLRARPESERIPAGYEDFLNLSNPTDLNVTFFSVLYLTNQVTD